MLTSKLIARAIAGQGSLDAAKAIATSRGWAPETFERVVTKLTAQVQRPRAASPKAPKAPRWQANVRRFTQPVVIPVTVAGPVLSGSATLTLTAERISTRADGEQFTSALGTIGRYAVRLSARQVDRLASAPITVWVGERAHKVVKTV